MAIKAEKQHGLVRSLNFRLVFFVSIFLLAAIGIFSYMMTRLEHDELISEVVSGSRRFSEGIKRSTRYAMLQFDREAMHHILEQVGGQENVERVRIYNKEGDIIVSTHPEEVNQRVDMHEEACYGCHKVDKPLEKLPITRTWRLFGEEGARRVGIVDPIYNEPDCCNAPCHAHPEDKKVLGVLDVIVSATEVDEMLSRSAWRRGIFTFLTIIIVGAVIGYYLYLTVSVPVRRLAAGTMRVAAGDLDYQIPITSATELGNLAESFNQMSHELKETYGKLQGKIEAADEDLKKAYIELQQKQQQLVQAAKMSSLGELAAGVAHEINNPLGTITLYAQMSADQLPKEMSDCNENMEIIIKHATRAAKIVRDLLEFARRGELEVKAVNLNGIFENVLSITNHQAELQQIRVDKELADTLPSVTGDPGKLQQVLVNIVINALQAMPDGGVLKVKSALSADGKMVEIEVSDTGCGIPEEAQKRIFDPFFTTKTTGKGTGLGLSVSHGIIQQHGGIITMASEAGKGTVFKISIPIAGKVKD